jgi:hypothetical protein
MVLGVTEITLDMKGVFTFKLQDREVGFKFGTYAISVACDKESCNIGDLFERIGFNKDGNVNLRALLHVWYGAAVHYCHHINKEVDFNTANVSDWLDEIGLDKVRATYVDGLKQFVPKNYTAPEKAGQTIAQ